MTDYTQHDNSTLYDGNGNLLWLITRYPSITLNPLTPDELETIYNICNKPTDQTEDVKRHIDLSEYTGRYSEDDINSHLVGEINQ
nr:hypothetical protein [Moritella viscosa]SHO03638.1 ParB-like partition protein [Moritella viscosa]